MHRRRSRVRSARLSGWPSRSTAGGELLLQSVAAHEGLVLFVGEVRQGDVPQPVVIVFNAAAAVASRAGRIIGA